jgi:hypothetical protein
MIIFNSLIILRRMNIFVVSFIVLIILASLFGLAGTIVYQNMYKSHWYLGVSAPSSQELYNFIKFITFMNLNAIIPSSLYVSFGNIII